MVPDFHTGEALFLFFASTSVEHINHVSGDVTDNKAPFVADKIKLEHLFL